MPKKASATVLPFLSVERSLSDGVANQIYGALRRAIENGVLRSGFRLPSTRELARQIGVSRNSAHDAYQRLIVEGFLRGRIGSGTYVIGPGVVIHASRSTVSLSRWAVRHLHHSTTMRVDRPFAAEAPAADEFSWPRWLQLVTAGWRTWHSGNAAEHGREALHELRSALAEHAAVVSGVSCTPQEILVGTAGDRLMTTVARLLADPGDRVLVDDPADRAARFLFELIGLHCTDAIVDEDGINVEQATDDVRLALLRPGGEGAHGVVMTPGRRYAAMAWAKARGVPIVEDDFDSVVDPPLMGLRPLKAIDSRGLCVYLADLSRTLMPGVAISYAVAPTTVVEAATRLLPAALPPIGEQLALAAYLRSNEFSRQIGRMRAAYTERRQALEHELCLKLGGAIVSVQRRGPLQLIARLSEKFRDVSVAEAAAALNLDVGVLSAIAPDEQGLILGYGGTPPSRIPQIVSALASAFDACAAGIAQHSTF